MKFNLTKNEFGDFVPASSADKKKADKVGKGEIFQCRTVNQRNAKLNAKYHVLMDIAWNNMPEKYDGYWGEVDDMRKEFTKALGFTKETTDFHGNRRKEARSTAFDKMDDETFQELYERSVDLVARFLGIERPDLMDKIIEEFG